MPVNSSSTLKKIHVEWFLQDSISNLSTFLSFSLINLSFGTGASTKNPGWVRKVYYFFPYIPNKTGLRVYMLYKREFVKIVCI